MQTLLDGYSSPQTLSGGKTLFGPRPLLRLLQVHRFEGPSYMKHTIRRFG